MPVVTSSGDLQVLHLLPVQCGVSDAVWEQRGDAYHSLHMGLLHIAARQSLLFYIKIVFFCFFFKDVEDVEQLWSLNRYRYRMIDGIMVKRASSLFFFDQAQTCCLATSRRDFRCSTRGNIWQQFNPSHNLNIAWEAPSRPSRQAL